MSTTDEEITPELVQQLVDIGREQVESSKQATIASEDLAKAIVERQEWNKTAKTRWQILGAGLIVVIVTLIVALVQINASLDAGRGARHTLLDCVQISTDPKTCYAQNQKNAGELIQRLNDHNEAIAVCQPELAGVPLAQRKAALDACIAALPKSP